MNLLGDAVLRAVYRRKQASYSARGLPRYVGPAVQRHRGRQQGPARIRGAISSSMVTYNSAHGRSRRPPVWPSDRGPSRSGFIVRSVVVLATVADLRDIRKKGQQRHLMLLYPTYTRELGHQAARPCHAI